MKKFEFLDHPADVKMRVYGKTLEELFRNAVLGMANIQISNLSQRKELKKLKVKKKIRVKSLDQETLLVDFLSAILTQSDINDCVYPEVKIKKFSEKEIEAEILGFKVSQFDEDIKGVTYHDLAMRKKRNIWQATVLFDI